MFEKITFTFYGLQLMEPMSLILNWVLAFQCMYYFKSVTSLHSADRLKPWSIAFMFYTASFILGGLAHFLYFYTGQAGKIPGWVAGILAISYMIKGLIDTLDGKNVKSRLQTILLIQTVIVVIGAVITTNFTFVIAHTASLIVYLFILSILRGTSTYIPFFLGILFLLAAAGVRVLQIDLHMWFNRDDFAHVFMILAIWSFYKGVLHLAERTQISV